MSIMLIQITLVNKIASIPCFYQSNMKKLLSKENLNLNVEIANIILKTRDSLNQKPGSGSSGTWIPVKDQESALPSSHGCSERVDSKRFRNRMLTRDTEKGTLIHIQNTLWHIIFCILYGDIGWQHLSETWVWS